MRKCQISNISVTPRFCITIAAMLLLLPTDWLFGWFIAVLIHEAGHVFALTICRHKIHAIVFDHTGIVMKTDPMHPAQEIFCALAGPVIGLGPLLVASLFPHTSVCALILSCFNMIPVYPLDGGRVVNGILQLIFDPLTAAAIKKFITKATYIILGILVMIAAFKFKIVLPLLLAAIILIFRSIQENFLANKQL